MNSAIGNVAPAPRLDVLRFPSDTSSRFALLIAAVAGASLFAYDWLVLGLLREPFHRTYRACEAAWTSVPDVKACVEPFERLQGGLILGGVALLFAAATVIFSLMPAQIIRQRRFVTLEPDASPELSAALDELAQLAGLRQRPTYLLEPLNGAVGGLAFGHVGRRYLVLQGGLVVCFANDPERFRAIMLHELAHLHSGDVDKAFFATSLWYAFVGLALAPLGLSLLLASLREDAGGLALGVLARALCLTAVVLMTFAAVLRSREISADLQAARWAGGAQALARALDGLARATGARKPRLLHLHPEPSLRRQVLEDPRPLLGVGAREAFATGLISAIALPELNTLAVLLLPATLEQFAGLVAATLTAPLAAAVLVVRVWRASVAALAGAGAAPRPWPIAVGLGGGLVAGLTLSLYMSIRTSPIPGGTAPAGDLIFLAVWAAVLGAGLLLFASWLTEAAALWAERASSARRSRISQFVIGTVAGAVLTAWVGIMLTVLGFGWSGIQFMLARLPIGRIGESLVAAPLTGALLTALWALPLAAALSPASRVSFAWALTNADLPVADVRPISFRRAALAGIAGGLLFAALLLCARVLLRATLSDAVRDSEHARALFVSGQVAVAVAVQAIVAIAVAGSTDRAGWVLGLFAAWLAGWTAAVSAVALVQAGYCVDPLAFGPGHSCAERVDAVVFELLGAPIQRFGAIATLPAALIASAAGRLVRTMLRASHGSALDLSPS